MASMYLNLPHLVLRLARHFLPDGVVRALLLRNIIIRPGLETSNPFAAVQRYVDVLSQQGLSFTGKRVLVFGYGGRFDIGFGAPGSMMHCLICGWTSGRSSPPPALLKL